jgi:sec-independent protein translocase protein TatB
MFGMGFTEILLIAVIAILFLGPDKLPSTMIEIAKFFRNVKNTIGTVKDSIEDEMHISDIKKEALAYKQELLKATDRVSQVTDIPKEVTRSLDTYADDILKDDEPEEEKSKEEETPQEPQEVTFKNKNKKKKKSKNLEPKEEKTDV